MIVGARRFNGYDRRAELRLRLSTNLLRPQFETRAEELYRREGLTRQALSRLINKVKDL